MARMFCSFFSWRLFTIAPRLLFTRQQGDSVRPNLLFLTNCLPVFNESTFIFSRRFTTNKALLNIVSFILSDIGEGIREVVVKEWHVKVGDKIQQFDPVCEVQSDKATVTITSRYDGIVRALHFEPNDTCAVGQALIDIEIGESFETIDASSTESTQTASTSDYAEPQQAASGIPPEINIDQPKVLATPSVRKIAADNNINISDVSGTGRDGRILKEDILNYLASGRQSAKSAFTTSPDTNDILVAKRQSTISPWTTAVKSPSHSMEDNVVSLSVIQRAMRTSMMQSNKIPHFVLSDELDLTNLVNFRTQTNELIKERYKLKLTYLPFFVKALSLALRDYPILNSHVDSECEKITYKGAHNIGIAMDTPEGLLVPNIKNVQNLTVIQIAQELERLQKLGSSGKLGPSELSGGTITLSNIGSIGGTYTAPRILPPEVLIGGIGRIQRVPRFDNNDNVHSAHIMYVSWAADHRIIDGATVTRFSKQWRAYLEQPTSFILELR